MTELARCTFCGYPSPSVLTRCPRCHSWGSFEQKIEEGKIAHGPKLLSDIVAPKIERYTLQNPILDNLLGGGLVSGYSYVFHGDPGAGKSTFALQLTFCFDHPLYITSEESEWAIKRRAKRVLESEHPHLRVWAISDIDRVLETDIEPHPDLVVLDSLQQFSTNEIGGGLGSSVQSKVIAEKVARWTRSGEGVVILISQENKDGELSGAKAVEHAVDGVLRVTMRGDRRILHVTKHRDGPAPVKAVCVFDGNGFQDFGEYSESEHGKKRRKKS